MPSPELESQRSRTLPEPLSTLLRTGAPIAGKYVLEGLLGKGGMGAVFAAEHTMLGQRVAIKFLVENGTVGPLAGRRLLREGRAAARIRSEHVVRVIDLGALASGLPFIVMEFLDGRDLSRLLEKHGRLPIPRSVDYVMEALEAVAEAHALRIVHRDLKPENLFLARQPDGSTIIKVLDFGISKVIEDGAGPVSSGPVTTSHSVLGSPTYMSPEQIQKARNVDGRTDIWSLGVVLYELIAGEPPFRGANTFKLLQEIMSDRLPSLRAKCPHAPEPLEQVTKCLARPREARYADAGELARALAPFGSKSAARSLESISGVIRNAQGSRAKDDPSSSSR
jgi:serine/threonine protein kinase